MLILNLNNNIRHSLRKGPITQLKQVLLSLILGIEAFIILLQFPLLSINSIALS
jgi:hypothetical protein